LISDDTPPRRMVSLCSVKTTSFARGYSTCPATWGFSGLEGCGVKKKRRPGRDWVNRSALARGERRLAHGYRRQVCEHAREEMEFAFARTFVEGDAEVHVRALYERIDEQGQCAHVYLCASRIRDRGCTAPCTRLGWVEWTGGGRGLKYGDLKGQEGSTGARRGSEIGKEHRGKISEGCLRVLQIRRVRGLR
jgi:hypothetical protein